MTIWNKPGYPHQGWIERDVNDGGDAIHTCEMCDKTDIRFVHTIYHPDAKLTVKVGCQCAQKLTDDKETPVRKEREAKARAAQKQRQNNNKKKFIDFNNWIKNEYGYYTKIHGVYVNLRTKYGNWYVVVNKRIITQFHNNCLSAVEEAANTIFDTI